MSEKVSIIIPVYNVEKYIEECLNSVVNQTYRNIEIIIVNDGSTDNSKKICKDFAQKDKRIIFVDDVNHGVSHARNIGLERATGDFITFVDSDDWIDKKMIETLYMNAVKYNSDIIACDYIIYDNSIEVLHSQRTEIEIITEKKEMYNKLFSRQFYGGYLWNKLIRKECIYKNKKLLISFNENIKIEEDTLFIANIIENIKKLVFIPSEKLYYYRIRNNSAVRFSYSKKDLSKLLSLKKFIEIKNKYNLNLDNQLEYEYYTLARQGKYIIKKEKILDNNLNKLIKTVSKKYFFKAISGVGLKEKIKVLLLAFIPNIYSKVCDNRKNRK